VGGAALGLGLALPSLQDHVYRLWNRLARWVSRAAALALLGICYFLIFAVLHWGGSPMARSIRRHGEKTGWIPRESLPTKTFLATWPTAGKADTAWLADLTAWARRSGHYWALSMIPFLFMLHLVKRSEPRAFVSNLYTLF
jgi:hypothetical protein